jgi:hypothetical protein
LVLGGASAMKPSFKGDLAAVRLHDEALTVEEITHNFKGGVMLGTEIHNWWRMEPDKWWVKESEHFRHCVDKEEMKGWSPQQLKEFNDRVPGMFNLATASNTESRSNRPTAVGWASTATSAGPARVPASSTRTNWSTVGRP